MCRFGFPKGENDKLTHVTVFMKVKNINKTKLKRKTDKEKKERAKMRK